MFERDPFGLNPQFSATEARGSAAPGRHDLRRQAYLERKKATLVEETAERQRQEDGASAAAVAGALNRTVARLAGLAESVRPSLRRRIAT